MINLIVLTVLYIWIHTWEKENARNGPDGQTPKQGRPNNNQTDPDQTGGDLLPTIPTDLLISRRLETASRVEYHIVEAT